jgi:hypothetical protein
LFPTPESIEKRQIERRKMEVKGPVEPRKRE